MKITRRAITAHSRLIVAQPKDVGYLYILSHGMGPGTLPKDVTVEGIIENENFPEYSGWKTFAILNRPLTPEEMDQFEVRMPGTDINLSREYEIYTAINSDKDKVTSVVENFTEEDVEDALFKSAEEYLSLLEPEDTEYPLVDGLFVYVSPYGTLQYEIDVMCEGLTYDETQELANILDGVVLKFDDFGYIEADYEGRLHGFVNR